MGRVHLLAGGWGGACSFYARDSSYNAHRRAVISKVSPLLCVSLARSLLRGRISCIALLGEKAGMELSRGLVVGSAGPRDASNQYLTTQAIFCRSYTLANEPFLDVYYRLSHDCVGIIKVIYLRTCVFTRA